MSTLVLAVSVLLAVLPAAVVDATIRPDHLTHTLHLVAFKLALILVAAGPSQDTGALQLVVNPMTGILSPVGPVVLALAFDIVFDELAIVSSAISPSEMTAAVHLVIDPHADVDIAVSADQATSAIGFVVAPPAFVYATVRPNHKAILLSSRSVIWLLVVIEVAEASVDLSDTVIVVKVFGIVGLDLVIGGGDFDCRLGDLSLDSLSLLCDSWFGGLDQ